MLFDRSGDRILLCERIKNPYLGLKNLPGGKIEVGEDGSSAAYREMEEETGFSKEDVQLQHLMDFRYYFQNCYVEVYVGQLRTEAAPKGEENPLFWSDLNHNFFDQTEYAGEGNIGHMMEQVKEYWEVLGLRKD